MLDARYSILVARASWLGVRGGNNWVPDNSIPGYALRSERRVNLGLIGFVLAFSKTPNCCHSLLLYDELSSFFVFLKLGLFCIIIRF